MLAWYDSAEDVQSLTVFRDSSGAVVDTALGYADPISISKYLHGINSIKDDKVGVGSKALTHPLSSARMFHIDKEERRYFVTVQDEVWNALAMSLSMGLAIVSSDTSGLQPPIRIRRY